MPLLCLIAMGDNIPVPAESLRRAVESAAYEMRQARADGRKATARSIQRSITAATERTEGKDGEYVSIEATHASTLAAHGHTSRVPDSRAYTDSIRHYLEQYGHW
jgi:hypothetical protein